MFKAARRYWRRATAIPPLAIFKRNRKPIIFRPRIIENPENIHFLGRAIIREYAWLSAISNYAGITYRPKLEIGDEVYIGRFSCITCIDRVSLGDRCVLSEQVYIADSSHGYDPEGGHIMAQSLDTRGPVLIGSDTFIGYGARILSGVTLGDHCIVGANSVVTKSFESYSMIAGMPAKLVRRYDPATKKWDAVT